jgi:hypothetical protein
VSPRSLSASSSRGWLARATPVHRSSTMCWQAPVFRDFSQLSEHFPLSPRPWSPGRGLSPFPPAEIRTHFSSHGGNQPVSSVAGVKLPSANPQPVEKCHFQKSRDAFTRVSVTRRRSPSGALRCKPKVMRLLTSSTMAASPAALRRCRGEPSLEEAARTLWLPCAGGSVSATAARAM